MLLNWLYCGSGGVRLSGHDALQSGAGALSVSAFFDVVFLAGLAS